MLKTFHFPLFLTIFQNPSFNIDSFALLICLFFLPLAYLLWKWKASFISPFIYFSNTDVFEQKKHIGHIPHLLSWLALLALILAFINPHLLFDKTLNTPNKENPIRPQPTKGIGIYLVLDQSGSMAQEVTFRRQPITKLNLLKNVTKEFIQGNLDRGLKGRPNDMIGLITFARGAQVLSPLTLDHRSIIEKLTHLTPIEERNQDGTSIGYAIFKSAHIIAATQHYAKELINKGDPAYTIENMIILLITDGLQDPNPLDKGKRLRNIDIPEASAYAKKFGIKLYIVNVEPKLAMETFAPNRRMMQKSAELTGGKFYMVDSTTDLETIYKEIDSLEKSDLFPTDSLLIDKNHRPDLYERLNFYPYLIGIGLCLLFSSIVLQSTFARKIP